MIERYALARGRILQELESLDLVVERVEEGMAKARSQPAEEALFLDAVALNLHDFYSGLERVLQYIATHVDRHVPSGGDWHRELLRQMQIEIPDIRPAILSARTVQVLDEYLRFRHIVRNVYTFEFDADRLDRLARGLRPCLEKTSSELRAYADFLLKIMNG